LAEAKRYVWEYPLMEWGWDLERCIQAIDDAGMPVPPKSACFFCPNQQPEEVCDLTPEERARTMRIEITAEPYNRRCHGLWRRPRKRDGRPGAITQYILAEGLPFLPLSSLDPIPTNPACAKARQGYTFQPPHAGPTLAQQVEDAVHRELILSL
jgi:hypothetical protein